MKISLPGDLQKEKQIRDSYAYARQIEEENKGKIQNKIE
jgi:hypothetical protein